MEILFPVENESLKKEVTKILQRQLEDNVKAHILQHDGTYLKVNRRGKQKFNSQDFFCREAIRYGKVKEENHMSRVFIPIEKI